MIYLKFFGVLTLLAFFYVYELEAQSVQVLSENEKPALSCVRIEGNQRNSVIRHTRRGDRIRRPARLFRKAKRRIRNLRLRRQSGTLTRRQRKRFRIQRKLRKFSRECRRAEPQDSTPPVADPPVSEPPVADPPESDPPEPDPPLVEGAYFVSTSGDDAGSGTIDDPFATIQKASNIMGPGDTVYVRGGVYRHTGVEDQHRGKIAVRAMASGEPGAPIAFRAYPGETPVLDGSDILGGWEKCSSQAACNDNPDWENIYVAEAEDELTVNSVTLYESDDLLYVAQDPDPAQALHWDLPDNWRLIPTADFTTTTIADPDYFTQGDENYWVGAYVLIWSCNNNIMQREVLNYYPDDHMIEFESFGHEGCITFDKDKFAMRNHASLVDRPGEFFLDEDSNEIYLWPLDEENLDKTALSIRTKGFDIRGQDHLVFDGFTLKKFSGEAIVNYNFGDSHTATDVLVKNNTVTQCGGSAIIFSGLSNSTAHGNYVYDNAGVGVHFGGGSKNVISGNTVSNVTGTALRFYAVKEGSIIDNLVKDNNGQHANAITTYLGAEDILIKGNTVINSKNYTLQRSSNIVVRENIFIGSGVSGWGGLTDGVHPSGITIENNTFTGSVYMNSDFHDVVVKNNILGGGGWGHEHSHNLFIALSWNQDEGDLPLHSSSLEPDMDKIFVDTDAANYQLKGDMVGNPLVDPCTMADHGGAVGAVLGSEGC